MPSLDVKLIAKDRDLPTFNEARDRNMWKAHRRPLGFAG
jgi:hypothetical protein